MENLINQLIDVDKQARRRVSAAKKDRAAAMDSLEDVKQKLKTENDARFAEFVDEENARRAQELETAKSQVEEAQKACLARLDAVVQENCEQWVDDVVKGVLSL